MNEERKKILNMLSEGKITVDEADKLFAALLTPAPFVHDTKETDTPGKIPNYLHVQVLCKGKDKVDIRIPLKIVRAGIKLTALVPEDIQNKMNQALREKGLDFDVKNLKGHEMDKFLMALADFHIDVVSEKETVKIFCE